MENLAELQLFCYRARRFQWFSIKLDELGSREGNSDDGVHVFYLSQKWLIERRHNEAADTELLNGSFPVDKVYVQCPAEALYLNKKASEFDWLKSKQTICKAFKMQKNVKVK